MSFKTICPRLLAYFNSVSTFGKISPSKKFFGIRLGFSMLLLGAASIAGIVVGARQIFNNSSINKENSRFGERLKNKKLDNVDIRVNLKNNLGQISEVTALAKSGKFNSVTEKTASFAADINKGITHLKAEHPNAESQFSSLTGAVEILRSNDGLSRVNPGRSGENIVREFITGNRQIYGLRESEIENLHFFGESNSAESGLRMVRVEQMVNDHPVFQSESRFILDRDGRIIESLGLMIPDGAAAASPLENLLSPQAALRLTAAQIDIQLDENQMNVSDESDNSKFILNAGSESITDQVTSKLVYFPVAPGILIPAWSQIIFTPDADFYVLVDARSGTLLWRKNIRDYASAQDARFRVYVQADGKTPADSPAPQSPSTATVGSNTQPAAIAPTIVGMHTAYDPVASQNGWIDDCPAGGCTANQTQTLGNNTLTCMDAVGSADANICDTSAAFVLDGNGRPTGNPDANGRNRDFLGTTPRDFQTNYLPPPQGGNPEAGQTATGDGNNGTLAIDQYRRGLVTQMFYMTNWYHDQLYELGFDEAAGNFQQMNFSGMGVGNDRVLGDAQDSSGTNNANFSTPPDGTSGRMQMYRFTGPTIDRDGGLDAEILLHELTHGTSNRLIGNGAGLNWNPARGMGEGWSDFYALSLVNNTNSDNPNGNYASGAYGTYKLSASYTDNYVYGIRRFPYSTVNTVNPITWADVDDITNDLSGGIAPDPLGFNNNGGMEVHNIGEVWCNTLWEVRSRIIADPAGSNGSVPTGSRKTLQIVTDGLKMTPLNPSFTEARDAILNADCATNACANETSIWGGFADRGLGYKSFAPNKIGGRYVAAHEGVKESFSSPYLDIANQTTDVTFTENQGNNNNAIDPGESINLNVKLTNPWRGATKTVASATATLTTTTPGITIAPSSSTYGVIAPQGSATGTKFVFKIADNMACGQSINFSVHTTSSLGTSDVPFTLRLGMASGTDPVITYTGNPNPDLTIVDNRPRGVSHSINITDDFQIADLNFRLDSITDPGVGDLTVMLKGPNGYGVDFVSLIDGLNDLGGTAITNMVIDDDVANTPANDMVEATSANAPYTKSWQPVYNSPWAALVNPALPADTIPELNYYNGISTKGTWSVLAADVFSAAGGGASGNGTLNAWSIQVTPVHFACAVFVPPTAAGASVNGKVTNAAGKPVSGAKVTSREQNGTSRSVITNSLGNFKFNEINTGQTVVFSISAKSYTFLPQVISLNNNLTGLNFTAR